MRIFLIEAYGGKEAIDGAIHRFTVQAETLDEAMHIVRRSAAGQRYNRFEAVEETGEFEAGEAGIIAEADGPHPSRS
jgi:hypothetical protein